MTTSNLPLHCSICPKKPDFSDVSHLLTHIASKGHLSHYYKIKVRSSNEEASRQLIEIYDQWYSDWNVEGLMMERMNLKDRKRSKTQGLSAALGLATKPLRRKEQQVDPQLTGNLFAAQSIGRGILPFQPEPRTPLPIFALPTGLPSKTHKPQLHLWSTRDPACVDAIALVPSSPILSSPPPFHGHLQRPAPLAQMFPRYEVDVEVDVEELGTEATKLKGVLWPGMNIFDAATPDMKRRRNQKKEISVVARLERNSSGVEANEMIFTPNGSLWKQRPISGHVDFDSSPYKIAPASSPPPRRKASSRAPLGTRDSNRSMLPPRRTSTSRRVQSRANARSPEDEAPALSRPTKKKKRDFMVFDDRNKETETETTDMRYLTSEFHYDQLPEYEPAQRAQTSLEGAMAALYQPAYHNNYFVEAFERFHPPLYGMPYHGYYGHTAYEIPGYFTYRPQASIPTPTQQGPEQAQARDDKTLSDSTQIASQAASEV